MKNLIIDIVWYSFCIIVITFGGTIVYLAEKNLHGMPASTLASLIVGCIVVIAGVAMAGNGTNDFYDNKSHNQELVETKEKLERVEEKLNKILNKARDCKDTGQLISASKILELGRNSNE